MAFSKWITLCSGSNLPILPSRHLRKIFSEGCSFIVLTFESGLVTVAVVGETVFEVKVPLIVAVSDAELVKGEVAIEVLVVGFADGNAEVVIVEVVDAALLKAEVMVEVLVVGVVDDALLKAEDVVEVLVV